MLKSLIRVARGILLSAAVVAGSAHAVHSASEYEYLEEKLAEYRRDNIRSIHKRIYSKYRRHEVTLMGGGIPRKDGYLLGGASYTYHLFESLGFEAGGFFGFQTENSNHSLMLGTVNLQFAPLYGKVSLFTWLILTFDINFTGGIGAARSNTDQNTSSVAGVVGAGTRIFLNRFMALKIEARDYFFRNDDASTVSDDIVLTNNLVVFGGISVFFPFRPD